MSLCLRQAAPDDYALSLQRLRAAEDDDNRVRAAMSDPANTTYIAYDDSTPIGAAIMHWQETEAEITHLAISEAIRRRGFGKKMIEALLAEARSRQMLAVLV